MSNKKRKAPAAAESSSPPKKSNGSIRPSKRPASSESEQELSDEEEQIEDHNEETVVEMGQCMYDPDEIRLLMESFVEFMKTKKSVSMNNLEKFLVDWSATLPESTQIDVSVLVSDCKKYLKSAIRLKNFQIQDAFAALMSYWTSERCLGDFKSFPVKPPTKIKLFCEKRNVHYRLSQLKDVYDQMRDEPAVMSEIAGELKALAVDHAAAIAKFMDDHPNLTAAQKHALNCIVKRVEKQSAKVAKTPRKGKKEPETAFTLFCRARADKYTDLSQEARERKLKKKFDKISDVERDLLESLAMNPN